MREAEGFISGRKGEGGFGVGEGGIVGVAGETGGAAGEQEHCGNDSGPCHSKSLVVASRTMGVSGVCVSDVVRQCSGVSARGPCGIESAC